TASDAPSPRSQHGAVVSYNAPFDSVSMLVYGGRNAAGSAFDGKIYRYSGLGGGVWSNFTPTGTVPAPRFGHSAIYDQDSLGHERMIVCGGIGADGQTPTDLTVWEMRFDAGKYVSGAWSALTQVVADIAGQDRRPAPRYGHTMVWDPHVHYNARAGKDGHVGFLFGGQLWTTAYSDTLWALWLFYD